MKWYKHLERINKKLIIPAIILLFFVIIGELFYHHELEPYHLIIEILDAIIICIFIIDLIFAYIRIRKFWPFVKKSWLDIIAVFPFFLLFRFFERLYFLARFGEQFKELQMYLHEGLEVEKEASKLAKESKVLKLTRSQRFLRFFRPGLRSLRFAKGIKERKTLKKTLKQEDTDLKKSSRKLEKKILNTKKKRKNKSKKQQKL